jgi:hypothetical protein
LGPKKYGQKPELSLLKEKAKKDQAMDRDDTMTI